MQTTHEHLQVRSGRPLLLASNIPAGGTDSFSKEIALARAGGHGPTQMCPGPLRQHAAPRGTLDQALLQQIRLDHLFQRYGARTFALLKLIDESPELAAPIVPTLLDIKAQIVFAVRDEMAFNFGDICRRRTMLSLQANYGLDALDAIAQTLQAHCQWSPEKCQKDIAAYKTLMAENCIPDYAIAATLGTETNIDTKSNSTVNKPPTGEAAPQLAVG